MIAAIMARNTAMLTGHDAAFSMMRNSDARMNLAFKANPSSNLDALFAQDKALMLDNQRNGLMYLISYYREQALQKKIDADIKKSFSTFA